MDLLHVAVKMQLHVGDKADAVMGQTGTAGAARPSLRPSLAPGV